MRSHFTDQQRADPVIAEASRIFTTCVHCGFCTATCPSYQILGDELDSPRGRIYLIKSMLERGEAADKTVVTHIDRCLSCLACMTTCPTEVNYKHLVDHARVHIEKTYRRPVLDRWFRAALAKILPYPKRFRALVRLGQFSRIFSFMMPRKLRGMLALVPSGGLPKPFRPENPGRNTQAAKVRVAVLQGCAQSVVGPEINRATWRLLTEIGCDPVAPPDAGCCGALTHHLGREGESQQQIRELIKAWETAEAVGGTFDYIVVSTSGCGSTIKDWGRLMENDPDFAARAQNFAARCRDLSEIVAALGLPPHLQNRTHPVGRRVVAWHPPCTLQHGQKIKNMPMDLLRQAGYDPIEIGESHLCCGSAGVYNMLQPEIAGQLRDRKIGHIKHAAPDLVASANIGCMMQIKSGTDIPVFHLAELLVGDVSSEISR
ncbi:MAG: glycolate oxidase subunit GlcF [Candidatus Symbiobacter sp.]|nr:glycolate oxidase subunit GlcF [Candidatus Symbiobacter sp.]